MPGSRKGERRGGANPNHVRKTAAPPKKRKPGQRGPDKTFVEPGLKNILVKRKGATAMEREIKMYDMIVGRSTRLPKDVMMDAMRYFENSAIDYAEVLRENMRRAAEAETPEEHALLNAAVGAAENQVDKYLSMSVDVAFKLAPFLHPKLAAMMVAQGNDKNAETLFAMLMRDLDEANKPAGYIEHDPTEVVE